MLVCAFPCMFVRMCVLACVFLPARVPMAEPLNVLPVVCFCVCVCVCALPCMCRCFVLTCGVCRCLCVCVCVWVVRAHVLACGVYCSGGQEVHRVRLNSTVALRPIHRTTAGYFYSTPTTHKETAHPTNKHVMVSDCGGNDKHTC